MASLCLHKGDLKAVSIGLIFVRCPQGQRRARAVQRVPHTGQPGEDGFHLEGEAIIVEGEIFVPLGELVDALGELFVGRRAHRVMCWLRRRMHRADEGTRHRRDLHYYRRRPKLKHEPSQGTASASRKAGPHRKSHQHRTRRQQLGSGLGTALANY
jgi:hypothetical protein